VNAIASRSSDLGLLALRLAAGVVFVFHGSQKLFGAFDGIGIDAFAGYLESLAVPAPLANAWIAALVELLGGLALLAGAATRIVSIPLAFTMLVASLTAHGGQFDAGKGGMEYTLTLMSIAIALALTGAGKISLDARLSRARPAPSEARPAAA
jgi:putative oxidoreductase